MTGRVREIADDILEREVASGEEAQGIAAALRRDGRFEEVVAGVRTVSVQFDPMLLPVGDALALLRGAAGGPSLPGTRADALTIPVRYGGEDGPDLPAVAAVSGLTEAEVIAAHLAGAHRVDLIGFTPGFAYVGGLDPRIRAERLDTPRPRVPPGAIGVITGRTGLYALGGPGGWPLIGRAAVSLFDAAAPDPFRLSPGHRIRFVQAAAAP